MTKKFSKPIKTLKRAKMTDWYDYKQLLDTAKKTVLSTLVGEYADPRLGMADPTHGRFFDYSNELRRLTANEARNVTEDQEHRDFKALEERARKEIWIDYVADVGDGWNSTYAVAYSLARQSIEFNGEELPRGEILIFGGDAVYPTASDQRYEDQLIAPYRAAFKASGNAPLNPTDEAVNLKAEPHVFALPGNHDWYDSLTAFKKVFCSDIFNDRRFASDKKSQNGGWQTRQKRSYFVLKLPHKWWLFGIDLQLSHNIDVEQLEYLESIIREKMSAGDKVILCVPEPYWVKAIKYENITGKFEEKEQSIQEIERYFEERKIDVKVYLAGDLHHYRRFEDEAKTQKITAGGGGAFLHPTHDFDFNAPPKKQPDEEIKEKDEKRRRYTLKKSYPEVEDSRKLDWKNLLFIGYNKTFGLVPAVLYAVLAALLHRKINYGFSFEPSIAFLYTSFITLLNNLTTVPLAVLVILLMLGGVYFFTDTNDEKYKRRAGLTHGFAHLFAVLFLGWLGFLFASALISRFAVTDETSRNLIWFISVIVVSFVGGYLIGSVIMGLYLLISLHRYGRHDNEAFSALKIEDHKNFLRLHISENGLKIYPLKIEKVPRSWTPVLSADGQSEEYYEPPAENRFPEPIENPIRVGEADFNQLNRQISERKKQ